MPTPTPDEIDAAIAEDLASGVQSVTTDGQTTVAMDIEKRQAAADRQRARSVASTTSGWGMARQARAVPPGAAPQ